MKLDIYNFLGPTRFSPFFSLS